MSSTGYVLAIDIGTSSTKALAVTPDGDVVASQEVATSLRHPSPGCAEQDPDEVLRAVLETASHVVGEAPGPCLGTSFSAHMHGLIALDGDGRPLTGCWTWADQRSAAQARQLHESGVAAGLHARTGTPVHAMSPLPKLIWMRENDPGTFAAARRFVSIKEYVIGELCGDHVIDYSVASSSGLFELAVLAWDEQALELAGVGAEQLSVPVATRHLLSARPDSGLPDAPVVVGATDGVLANLGVDAVRPGVLAVTLGTSGAARAVVERPVIDPTGRLFCYALDSDQWVTGGAIHSAGLVVRWLAELFGAAPQGGSVQRSFEELVVRAGEVEPGAGGLLCLPLLAGERFAAWRPDASGVFAGMTGSHHKGHLARAVLEGILGCLHTVVRAVEECTQPAEEVRFGGGMARSAVVRQMLADVLGRCVAMPASEQSSGLGAARLALRTLGGDADWKCELAHRHEPDPGAAAVYEELVALQRKLYEQNESLMGELAAWRRDPPSR